mmetsp:Transcript_25087/g.57761  ORF Transcript_25087/g.57761 Transcript_25087/m.57761 type:complete len:272 (+) Transcript_25087:984-1799(+)
MICTCSTLKTVTLGPGARCRFQGLRPHLARRTPRRCSETLSSFLAVRTVVARPATTSICSISKNAAGAHQISQALLRLLASRTSPLWPANWSSLEARVRGSWMTCGCSRRLQTNSPLAWPPRKQGGRETRNAEPLMKQDGKLSGSGCGRRHSPNSTAKPRPSLTSKRRRKVRSWRSSGRQSSRRWRRSARRKQKPNDELARRRQPSIDSEWAAGLTPRPFLRTSRLKKRVAQAPQPVLRPRQPQAPSRSPSARKKLSLARGSSSDRRLSIK